MKRLCIVGFLFLAFSFTQISGQPILLDEAVSAEGLICFPVYGDSLSFRYLPSRGRLAINDQSLPEFSFLRYATVQKNTTVSAKSISEAEGGGLVHFLAIYDTPETLIRRAENSLRMSMRNQKVSIKGPVLFSKGDYTVVSSILGQDGREEKKLIGIGQAPVFENSKVAFSFLLEPLEAQLLMESFKMSTPDISIVFELTFSGLLQAYEAEVEVNWSEVQKNELYYQKTNFLFFSSEIQKSFNELTQTGAIKVRAAGQDSLMERIFDVAYEKLLNLMFNPVKPSEIPGDKKVGFLADIFGAGGVFSPVLVGASRSYKLRVLKTEGKASLSLNSRSQAERRHIVTFNIGDLYQNYGQDKRLFKDVVLDDPAFQQREVLISIDGALQAAFENVVKNASVTLRKRHQNGQETLREIVLTKQALQDNQGRLSMAYLNQEDNDRMKWLEYEYQVLWNFGAEGNYHTGWIPESTPIINLYAPYKRHLIVLDGDSDLLNTENVRAVSVRVSYPFFGKEQRKQITIRPGDNLADKYFDVILPVDQQFVDYNITWIRKDGSTLTRSGKDEFGIIFIDEFPPNK